MMMRFRTETLTGGCMRITMTVEPRIYSDQQLILKIEVRENGKVYQHENWLEQSMYVDKSIFMRVIQSMGYALQSMIAKDVVVKTESEL